MSKKRVVITGIGALSPLGHDVDTMLDSLRAETNKVQRMQAWADYEGLNTQVGVPCAPFELPADRYNRKSMRSMGRVAQMATRSAELALEQAGLLGDPLVTSGRLGVSFGSSSGTPGAVGDFGRMITSRSIEGINANTYVKMMSHTATVNIAVFFGITGRIITTSSACTSGSQGLGYAYEAILSGRQVAMLAGGAEELDATQAAVFDTLFATSTRYNQQPRTTPRPFDAERDGLVLGEGACTFLLEDYDHAKARGARMLGEIVGYGTNCDGTHVTQPQSATMAQAMRLALEDAGLPPSAIPYVNAHGTSTDQGDVAESQGTHSVFGEKVAISSLKSYMGHTLGACGALEAWMTLEMMRTGWFAPTLNLQQVDPRCGDLDYVKAGGRALHTEFAMTNNFAFGGINTSLILRRLD
ncbi:beta-ketoacyl-ACP synthase [Roseateles terrae]|uniref:3-oxoacyl-[acyl-carrier-protein] synthase II n=1 Tax=Roseateles terrae TaxID=431060 RepID=A0ABR6GSX0_9BURK|nr:beta-ketoacyl-ACP synthase [Roseateles terrae]MBB3194248.1 3-oxoacyl-[acyl-carrier-protein] synthase II [Roseateles terrae]OWQ88092.1 beta-ketoacyl-ACP synthase II [Roseateles terrae]